MATDGGQIRTKIKVLGEQNHSKTCLTPDVLVLNGVLVASEIKTIAHKLATKKGILITDASGNAAFIQVPDGIAGYNKILSTNTESNLVWIDK